MEKYHHKSWTSMSQNWKVYQGHNQIAPYLEDYGPQEIYSNIYVA